MKRIPPYLLILIILLGHTSPVRADIAPPAQPPGANVTPGSESTQVRMIAETVLIEIREQAPDNSLGVADVTASFTMQNLGTSAEAMAARFPISTNDGFFNYPEITDLQIMVEGRLVNTRRITIPDPDDNDYPLPWAEFDVNFPPGEDVSIEVSYTLHGWGEYPYIAFGYILETGAGWRGTIGSVDLIVQLPYEANIHNVFIESGPGWGSTTAGATLDGQMVRWHYDDLEPAPEHNLSIALVMPSAWTEVLTEQTNVSQNPQDGEAWGRLGKIYKEISRLRRGSRYDTGGLELFALSAEAYEQAVTLLPDDALWHAGYAELLFDHYYWDELGKSGKPGTIRALHALARAYELDPDEPFILDLLDNVRFALPEALQVDGDNYVFQWLTATPTFLPSSTLTNTPRPTLIPVTLLSEVTPIAESLATQTSFVTQAPTMTSSPSPPSEQISPQPTPRPILPICGTAIPIPLALLFIFRRKKQGQR